MHPGGLHPRGLGRPPPHWILRDKVNERAVRILLEYILVTACKRSLGQGNIFSSVCQEFCPLGGIPACLAGGIPAYLAGLPGGWVSQHALQISRPTPKGGGLRGLAGGGSPGPHPGRGVGGGGLVYPSMHWGRSPPPPPPPADGYSGYKTSFLILLECILVKFKSCYSKKFHHFINRFAFELSYFILFLNMSVVIFRRK